MCAIAFVGVGVGVSTSFQRFYEFVFVYVFPHSLVCGCVHVLASVVCGPD